MIHVFKQKYRLIESIIKKDLILYMTKMDDITLVAITFTIVGMTEIIMGIPLLYQKIKPNWLYGFRLPSTVSNKEVWYKINVHTGRGFIYAGIILVISSLFLLMFDLNLSLTELSLILLIMLLVPLNAVLVSGFLYLKKLKK